MTDEQLEGLAEYWETKVSPSWGKTDGNV